MVSSRKREFRNLIEKVATRSDRNRFLVSEKVTSP